MGNDIEKLMMRNEAKNNKEQNLIGENETAQIETTEKVNRKVEFGHVKNSDMSEGMGQKIADNNTKKQSNLKSMARLPFEQMAFKSGGFPSPQLIVIKTNSISLDKIWQIRQLAISQGHYITSVFDGKIGEEVLKVVERHPPLSSYHRAVRQIELERTQTGPSQDIVPPVKSPRLHNQPNTSEVN